MNCYFQQWDNSISQSLINSISALLAWYSSTFFFQDILQYLVKCFREVKGSSSFRLLLKLLESSEKINSFISIFHKITLLLIIFLGLNYFLIEYWVSSVFHYFTLLRFASRLTFHSYSFPPRILALLQGSKFVAR